MGKIFITSDTHFGHDREFLYKPRGFNSIREHDEEVIRRWNEVVGPEDEVYHLGDVMLNNNEHGLECLKLLNGTIHILAGNHDTNARIALYQNLENIIVEPLAMRLKYKKYNFYLSHYPTMTSNLEGSPHLREHTINLYGHTHQKTNFYQDMPFMYHVGLDSHDCYPVLLDDAIEDMRNEVKKCLEMLDQPILAPAADYIGVEQATSSNVYTPQNYKINFTKGVNLALCSKCVYTYPSCGQDPDVVSCPGFKRDPPDGGFYG